MMSKLILVRGLPGSGKSFCAENDILFSVAEAEQGVYCFAADDWMVDEDCEYKFDPSLLSYCDDRCKAKTLMHLDLGETVIVHNTFTELWEMRPYADMIKDVQGELVILDLYDAGMSDEKLAARNVHRVPVEVIAKMRKRWSTLAAIGVGPLRDWVDAIELRGTTEYNRTWRTPWYFDYRKGS
jgi:predicted kinase